jgi:hypothetical protein
MSSAFKVITPVSTEPIALADAKAYLRVDFTDEDTLISEIITRARSYIETVTHRALATQTIQCIYTIERPTGGELSGPVNEGPNWYQYQEQLGANPFGAAQFYFDLPMPPYQDGQTPTVETRTTVFDAWTTFTNGLYTIDDVQEPARIYFQDPVTANQWRFTYVAGYNVSYPIPPDLLQPMYELISYWYNYREAPALPHALMDKLLAKKVDWI